MPKLNKLFWSGMLLLYSSAASAQAQGGGGASFKQGLGAILGLIMMIGFCVGLGLMIKGGIAYTREEEYTKWLIGGGIIAGASALMAALYGIFGLGEFAVDPSSSNW